MLGAFHYLVIGLFGFAWMCFGVFAFDAFQKGNIEWFIAFCAIIGILSGFFAMIISRSFISFIGKPCAKAIA